MKFPSLDWYDHHNVPYIALPQNGWMGPVWTGHQMILDTKEGYGDFLFFHELCHFLAASPSQRELPDFGLDRATNSTDEPVAIYGLKRFDDLRFAGQRGWAGEECAPIDETFKQEGLACDAMWFYAPIVLGDWKSTVGFAEADDFSGGNYPSSWSPVEKLNVYSFLKANFYEDLTIAQFDNYFREHLLTYGL